MSREVGSLADDYLQGVALTPGSGRIKKVAVTNCKCHNCGEIAMALSKVDA